MHIEDAQGSASAAASHPALKAHKAAKQLLLSGVRTEAPSAFYRLSLLAGSHSQRMWQGVAASRWGVEANKAAWQLHAVSHRVQYVYIDASAIV